MILKKYHYIDSLRGIAIILVLFSHFRYIFTTEEILSNNVFRKLFSIFDLGSKGVQLFYILSAFTLFNSYYIRKKDGTNNAIFFFIRRFFRIAPLFYICILLMYINNQFNFLQNQIFFSNRIISDKITYSIINNDCWYLSTITFINGFFPSYIQSPYPGGWSIAVEFSFYMLIPLLVKYIININKSLVLLGLSFSSSFIIEYLIYSLKLKGVFAEFLILSLLHQFYFFSIGIFIFFLQNSFTGNFKKINLITFIILLLSLSIKSIPLISGIAFALLLIKHKNIKLLTFPVLQYIGKISFSLYLVQWWAIVVVSKIHLFSKTSPILLFFLYISLSIAISSLTYLIEKYFIKLGEKLLNKI